MAECTHTIAEVTEYLNRACPLCEIDCLKAELAAKDEALQRLRNWAKAYPLPIFPKPDLKKAREVLEAAGMTLDAISADNMRHVITRVQEIIEQALKGKDNGSN